MNVKSIRRTVLLSVALALVSLAAPAQTDTTWRNAQSAAAAAAKKNATGTRRVLGSTLPGRTAMVMAAIRAELQMTEPMALP